MTVTASTFSNNSADRGAAIFNDDTLTITTSTFSGNSAEGWGGAIYNSSGDMLTITASTFSDNSAGSNGGAIYNTGGATMTAGTFSGNSANQNGGAIYNTSASTLTVAASILASSPVGDNCFNIGTLTSNSYNLSDDDSCGFGSIGDIEEGEANLAALSNNGGPTQTMLPQAPADALEAIPAADCQTYSSTPDQRGVSRPQGDCEIGAVEIQEAITVCANNYTGAVSAAPASGCPANSEALALPAATPETLCINPYTGALTWSPTGSCPPNQMARIVPADGPLSYCQSIYTGRLRYSADGQCGAHETPGVIPG